jgi:hypothetical protein
VRAGVPPQPFILLPKTLTTDVFFKRETAGYGKLMTIFGSVFFQNVVVAYFNCKNNFIIIKLPNQPDAFVRSAFITFGIAL